jgi:hypothetical protein
VTLSLTTARGFPRSATIASSSRATLAPDSEVSATSARHSRVKSSPRKGCGTADHSPACRTRSPVTNGGSAPAVAPSAPGCPMPASGRRGGAPSAPPLDRDAAASCGSAPDPHGPASSPGADSRTADAQPPVLAAAAAGQHHPPGSADTAPPDGQFRSDHTPDARSARDTPGHGRPHPASRRASPFSVEMFLRTAMSSIASASSFFSLAFSSSSVRSRLASATSRPPNFAFHL